jgi:hypothetical protein
MALMIAGCASKTYPMVMFPDKREPRTVLSYADSATQITYLVEKDRRHVQAKNSDGTTRWRRNPFVDAKLGSYRFPHPQITYIGKAHPWQLEGHNKHSVAVGFNSSQFGIVNPDTGDFTCQGND